MIKKTKLSNGLTIVTHSNKSVQTMIAAVGVHTGNKNELEREIGLSHALEHMLFKGTETRTYEDLNNTVEGEGAYFNAYTSNEQTVYYIKGLKNHLGMAIDILADQVQRSIFPIAEITKEMGVIVQEMKRSYDNPSDQVYHGFMKAAFKGSTLEHPILGSMDQVMAYTPKDMFNYYKKHYHPSNMILSVAGNVDHKKVVALAKQHFKKEKNKFSPKKISTAKWVSGETLVHTDAQQQVNVTVGWKTLGRKNSTQKDRIMLSLANAILGSGMGSMLCEEVREKRGLSYAISSYTEIFDELGYIAVSGGTDCEKLESFMDAVALVMRSFGKNVTEAQLKKAKNSLKTAVCSQEESIENVALSNINSLQNYGKLSDTEKTLKIIDSITLDDVKKVMAAALSSRPVLSIYGNAPTLNDPMNHINLQVFEEKLAE